MMYEPAVMVLPHTYGVSSGHENVVPTPFAPYCWMQSKVEEPAAQAGCVEVWGTGTVHVYLPLVDCPLAIRPRFCEPQGMAAGSLFSAQAISPAEGFNLTSHRPTADPAGAFCEFHEMPSVPPCETFCPDPGEETFIDAFDVGAPTVTVRSEEHTSELQSHVNLVCRLLLEKKPHTASPARHPHAHIPQSEPHP